MAGPAPRCTTRDDVVIKPDDNQNGSSSPATGEDKGELALLDMVEQLDICLIDPSYGIKDAQAITGVSGATIRRWLSGYPARVQEVKAKWINHNDRWPDPLLVSFLELIEVLVAGKLKAATGKTLAGVRRYNSALSSEWEVIFPFAHRNMLNQRDALPEPVLKTLGQLDYENGFASRWLPFGKDGSLALDPRRAGGQPAIKGRRLRVVDIRGYFVAGDSIDFLAEDFDLDREAVEAALRFAFVTKL